MNYCRGDSFRPPNHILVTTFRSLKWVLSLVLSRKAMHSQVFCCLHLTPNFSSTPPKSKEERIDYEWMNEWMNEKSLNQKSGLAISIQPRTNKHPNPGQRSPDDIHHPVSCLLFPGIFIFPILWFQKLGKFFQNNSKKKGSQTYTLDKWNFQIFFGWKSSQFFFF